ncbi:hypothetical protein HJD18_02450 [Thermoleophilia bacterium SCSIO 60948]|nr:hypothetical protein HJD18_02450 [Thermoleophilia bacterium SCSIO 60948]
MANHLTPEELADHHDMEREQVLAHCVENGVPILAGRVDKTLFAASLAADSQSAEAQRPAA